jgi:hypothetical protein
LCRLADPADLAGMDARTTELIPHPAGEQSQVEELCAFGGRVRVEWDATCPVTPLGQLPFFIDYLKQGGLFDAWVADCPLVLSSPNAPRKRDLLGTLLLSTLAGHYRYAHVTSLRCDAVNPPLLGMNKLVREDSLRRNLAKIDEAAGLNWLQNHLDYCTTPLLSEPWVLDIDTTAKPLYGHQEGAAVGYNPHKPGRPSHSYHTYIMSSLRLVLRVDVLPGNEHNVAHATLGQLYRDRADCENAFDELKNQWGWGGFTMRDLKRCRLGGACSFAWPTRTTIARRLPPDHCCCRRCSPNPACWPSETHHQQLACQPARGAPSLYQDCSLPG